MKKASKTNRSEEIFFAIRRLMQTGEIYTKELDKKFGVSATQLNCIHALNTNGPIPISRIADCMMVKSSTVTGVIDRLEQKGLAQRERSGIDRRVITIRLTRKGKQLAENIPSSIHQNIVQGLNGLSSKEVDQIADALNKLTRMIYTNEDGKEYQNKNT